jgi:CoA:oxalate CoA-transferase
MKALEGIRVLDLTHALAGPFCTYHLQLLGAEVIKIERPNLGDDFRDFARLPGWEVSPSFIAVNGGKRSITVNLKDGDGQLVVRRLAATADVVVENLRPGAAKELYLGWDDLRQANPRLIYCSISGFGQSGEMSRWPAYDHTVQAIAGMSWSGRDDDVPSQGRAFSVDCFAGYVAFAQILGSLVRRERSGQGNIWMWPCLMPAWCCWPLAVFASSSPATISLQRSPSSTSGPQLRPTVRVTAGCG